MIVPLPLAILLPLPTFSTAPFVAIFNLFFLAFLNVNQSLCASTPSSVTSSLLLPEELLLCP